VIKFFVQEAQCSLNPVSGETQRYPSTDPVTGMQVPLICSNFDAHKINEASVSKF
jgi:hypothetical protein